MECSLTLLNPQRKESKMDFVPAIKMIKLTKEITIFVPCWWLISIYILVIALLIGTLFVKFFNGGEKLSCVLLSFLTFAYYFPFMLPTKVAKYKWEIVAEHVWEITEVYLFFASILIVGQILYIRSLKVRKITRPRELYAILWGCILGALGGIFFALVVDS